ncbi:MAG: kelch repeat-containing protein [Myxococcota bacterium]
MKRYIKSISMLTSLIVISLLLSCSDEEGSSGLNVKPYFGVIERYACDINNPPKYGEAPCDIDSFRLCAYSEKLNSIICNEYSVDEGKSGAQLKLPEAEDFRIFFQGFNKEKPDLMLWCGATDRISLKKGEKKDISVFIGRCSDFVFTRNKMNSKRAFHTSTLLKDGRVLIAGGISSVSSNSCDPNCDGRNCKPYCRIAEAISDVEIYDFRTGEFKKVGKLNIPRALHTATLLEDGRVIIAGGSKSVRLYLTPDKNKPFVMPDSMDEASITIEVFDPTTNSFKKIQSEVSRAMHTAYLAPNGKIYAFGGISNNSGDFESRIAEIDPSRGFVDTKISLTIGRIMPSIVDFSTVDSTSTAAALVGGAVIDEENDKGNSFDIISFADATPSVKEHRYSVKDGYILSSFGLNALPVDNGKFLLCGGLFMKDIKIGFAGSDIEVVANNPLDYAYYFDINNNNVSNPERNNNMLSRRVLYQMIYMHSKNPRILITGGFEAANPEYASDDSFLPYVPGRDVELFLVHSELFDSIHPAGIVNPANPVVRMNEARAGHTIQMLPDQTILVVGGFSSPNTISDTAEVFQPYSTDKDVSLLVY